MILSLEKKIWILFDDGLALALPEDLFPRIDIPELTINMKDMTSEWNIREEIGIGVANLRGIARLEMYR